MRSLVAVLALGLAACGSDGQTGNNAAVTEETGAAEVTAANDSTAIDAATGEAANMAADVNYMLEDLDNESANVSAANNSANNAN